MTMKTLTAAAVLALATPAFADAPTVESVDVSFDMQAIESAAAAQFWTDLEGDLETAIIARVAPQIGDFGASIEVNIDEFDMSNSFRAALGADSTLAGSVAVKNKPDTSINTFYDLSVTLEQAGAMLFGEDNFEIATIPEEEAYAALIDAFAANVASKVK